MNITVESASLTAAAEHAHSVQFYDDDAYLLDGVTSLVADALESGGGAVVIATAEHRDALAMRLAGQGVSPSDLAERGRYLSLDAASTLELFMVDGRPDAARFEATIGGVLTCARSVLGRPEGRIAAFGEMVALLYADGNAQAALELEQLWNDLARSHAFSLHCAYPLKVFAREQMASGSTTSALPTAT